MSLRSCVAVIVLLFFASAGGSLGLAQQEANNQDQQIMTPVSGPSGSAGEEATDSRKLLVDRLNLKTFEAMLGDLSLCGEDNICLRQVEEVKSLVCVAGVCDGTNKSKKPVDCIKEISGKYSKEIEDQINSSMCSLIESPSHVTRQAFLGHFSDPDATEDELVEYGAYLLALKGSAGPCEDSIKNYVGTYLPQWNYQWYRALSGCRILAHETTRDLEEKGFYTWFGVVRGSGSCSDISISEMRDECNAPGAASPVPSPAQPPVHAQ
jgi:hypothetical protein